MPTLEEAHRQGLRDGFEIVLKTISEKNVKTTEELIPGLLFALKELSEDRTLQ